MRTFSYTDSFTSPSFDGIYWSFCSPAYSTQILRRERKAQAQKDKVAGNAAYVKKDFEIAIEHYSKAIELDDEDISFLTDRAAVYLEMAKGGGAMEISGSPTERATLQWAVNLGMDFGATRSDSAIMHAFPFKSEKKRGGVALKLILFLQTPFIGILSFWQSTSEFRVCWKSAAEIVEMDEEKERNKVDMDVESCFPLAFDCNYHRSRPG